MNRLLPFSHPKPLVAKQTLSYLFAAEKKNMPGLYLSWIIIIRATGNSESKRYGTSPDLRSFHQAQRVKSFSSGKLMVS